MEIETSNSVGRLSVAIERVDGKASLKGAWLSQVNHFNFGGNNRIPGTADRLRRCELSSPVSVINF